MTSVQKFPVFKFVTLVENLLLCGVYRSKMVKSRIFLSSCVWSLIFYAYHMHIFRIYAHLGISIQKVLCDKMMSCVPKIGGWKHS